MQQNVEERVRRIIAENSNSEKAKEIGLTESLQNFGINSISFIKIIVSLEKEFGVEFDDEETSFEEFDSIQSIINCVGRMSKA